MIRIYQKSRIERPKRESDEGNYKENLKSGKEMQNEKMNPLYSGFKIEQQVA